MRKVYDKIRIAVKRSRSGQSTVEAAFVIPLLFTLLLLLLQPGILLYNLMVMEAAAGEACRLLATRTDELGLPDESYKEYVIRRLGSIPPQEVFHKHEGGCSWDIVLQGDEHAETVTVEISHRVKPLPLLDLGSKVLGVGDSQGYLEQKVSRSLPTHPSWVAENELGLAPKAWVEQWK